MKILILAERYTKGADYSLQYIHSRNIRYIENNIYVTVLNFSEKNRYSIDGITVYGEQELLKNAPLDEFDIVLSHAPNLKNHFRFILKHKKKIKRILFFIHGHEVLIKDKYYPKPYQYQKRKLAHQIIHFMYDRVKVKLVKYLITYLLKRVQLHIVFVSQWMEDEFYRCIKIHKVDLKNKTSIIPNPVNQIFIDNQYSPSNDLLGDFITIRPFDGPKYCVDLIWKLAKMYPNFKFTIYGEGNFFNYHAPPENLVVKKHFLKHEDIPEILNHYKAAIMLTRLDSQGVMACEMAAYGIPLITSDIPLTRKIFKDVTNVEFMPNDLSKDLNNFKLPSMNNQDLRDKLSDNETLKREINLFSSTEKFKILFFKE